jgi:hypothetical protein
MSNEMKLAAAIDRLSREVARNTAATERARLDAGKTLKSSLKSFGELLKRLPHPLKPGLSVASSSGEKRRARRRAA